MKITDPSIIKDSENHLIESIKSDLDWGALEELIKDKFSLSNLECNHGDIAVHNGKIVYKLDLEVKMGLTVMFDREGSYVPMGEEEPPSEVDIDHQLTVEDDEMQAVLQRSRDFWEKESQKKTEEPEAPAKEDDLQAVLKRNREFWADKSAGTLSEAGTAETETDDLQDVLKRNREFWAEKSGQTPADQPDAGDDFQAVLKRNREFWTSQSSSVEKHDESAGRDTELEDVLKKNREFWTGRAS